MNVGLAYVLLHAPLLLHTLQYHLVPKPLYLMQGVLPYVDLFGGTKVTATRRHMHASSLHGSMLGCLRSALRLFIDVPQIPEAFEIHS